MDEYLDEETDWVKDAMAKICKEWDQQVRLSSSFPSPSTRLDLLDPRSLTSFFDPLPQLKNDSSRPIGSTPTSTTFLTSQNPAQVKKNVLASFRDVLLLPVTIIPRTAVYVVSAGSTAAVQGLSMLNPQNWQATVVSGKAGANGAKGNGDATVFELGDDEDDEKQFPNCECNFLGYLLVPFASSLRLFSVSQPPPTLPSPPPTDSPSSPLAPLPPPPTPLTPLAQPLPFLLHHLQQPSNPSNSSSPSTSLSNSFTPIERPSNESKPSKPTPVEQELESRRPSRRSSSCFFKR